MNLKSEKGLSGVDMTVGIIIFLIGTAVIFNMYVILFSMSSKIKVNQVIVGYITEICEEIDFESYDEITEARVQDIIEAANIPTQYQVSASIRKYQDEAREATGVDVEDLVKRVNINVRYSIDGQNRDYTVGKIKVKER